MSVSAPLDLLHGGQDRVIASYLVETSDGLALFDCGPASCLETLKRRLGELGLELADIAHLLLSHIHLDHAGAAGALVHEHPQLQVHVSEIGAPHLVDPSRLMASARRLYGDSLDELWGELAPVPRANVHLTTERVLGMECWPTPGHASHHVVYLANDGTLLCGDAAGVRIQPSVFVMPPTPPPEVDVEAWFATIDEIERRGPERLALVHFGVASDVPIHLASLRRRLEEWPALVAAGASEDEFVREVTAALRSVDETVADVYVQAMPLWQSYAGLRRYVDKRAPTPL